MSVLSSLKLVAAKRPNFIPVVQVRRNKLSAKLDDQINLAKAIKSGETYAPTAMRTIQDPQTGETKRVAVPRRVRQWWFAGDGGKVCLEVKYGSKVLMLGKDKTAVEVANNDDLLKALDLLKQATIAGELDAQLEGAGDRLRKGFKKK